MPTRRERLRIFRRDDYTCYYCELRFEVADLELDHLHPKSWGGGDRDENYVTACVGCNRAKAGRPVRGVTRGEALDTLITAELSPTDRAAKRNAAAIERGDVPVVSDAVSDEGYRESRRAR